MNLLSWLIIGGFAGWIAKKIAGGKKGLLSNIILGIVGSYVGGFIISVLARVDVVARFDWRTLITAIIGSVVVLSAWNAFSGRK